MVTLLITEDKGASVCGALSVGLYKDFGELADNNSDYLFQLFQSQAVRGHRARAAGILKLLSLYLPAAEIEGLHAQIAGPLQPAQQREQEIRRLVKKRGIKHLVHFTQACNVRSIFNHGLLPRQALFEQWGGRSDSFKANDEYRYDLHLDASCLSISFPNYRMFFRYMKANPDRFWVILLIKPEILWKMDCAFCKTNASANSIRSVPLEELKSASALAALFDDYENGPTRIARSSLSIPKSFPTNPQAEVLVFGMIPAQDITAVYLKRRDESYSLYALSWKGIPVRIKPDYFGPRLDYAFWKN